MQLKKPSGLFLNEKNISLRAIAPGNSVLLLSRKVISSRGFKAVRRACSLTKSGKELEADIIITATGFHMSVLGDNLERAVAESVPPSKKASRRI